MEARLRVDALGAVAVAVEEFEFFLHVNQDR